MDVEMLAISKRLKIFPDAIDAIKHELNSFIMLNTIGPQSSQINTVIIRKQELLLHAAMQNIYPNPFFLSLM